MTHADRGQNPELRTALKNTTKVALEMSKLLDSLEITVTKLKKSDWSNRKKNLNTFNGPLLSRTRIKVNNLCNKNWEKLMNNLSVIKSIVYNSRMKPLGSFERLLKRWEDEQEKMEVYGGSIIKELSVSKESAVYKALTDKTVKKPLDILVNLSDEIISFRKIVGTIALNSKNTEALFAIRGLSGLMLEVD